MIIIQLCTSSASCVLWTNYISPAVSRSDNNIVSNYWKGWAADDDDDDDVIVQRNAVEANQIYLIVLTKHKGFD